jgi:hypothetical protein
MQNVYKILVIKLEGGPLHAHEGRTTFKWILNKLCMRALTGFNWVRVEFNSGIFFGVP